MFNARHDRASIKFNMINPETGNRVKMVTQDSETGDDLQRGKLSKGYEYTKNKYLILTDEDFDSVKVDSSAIMTVEKFVDAGSIDPMYFDSSYYLAPDGKAGEDVYAVLRQAITQTGKVALTRIVISQRERVVALRPMGAGLMAHTLHEERDINSADQYFEDAAELKTDPEMVDLAMQLIKRQSAEYDPADFEDRYETRLRAMIDAKLAGKGLDPEVEQQADRGNVIDLVAALKKSLAEATAAERRPATKAATTAAREEVAVAKSAKTRSQKALSPEDRNQTSFKLPIEGGGSRGGAERGSSTKLDKQASSVPAKPTGRKKSA